MTGKVILFTGMALLLGSTNAWTMEKDGQVSDGPGGMHGQKAMAGLTDITPEQKAKFKKITAAHKAEAEPLHLQAKERVKELKSLVASKAGDEAINAKLAELKKIRMAMQDLQKKYMEQREQVLTPTQRANMALKMGDRKDGEQGMKGKKGMKCEKKGMSEDPETKE